MIVKIESDTDDLYETKLLQLIGQEDNIEEVIIKYKKNNYNNYLKCDDDFIDKNSLDIVNNQWFLTNYKLYEKIFKRVTLKEIDG